MSTIATHLSPPGRWPAGAWIGPGCCRILPELLALGLGLALGRSFLVAVALSLLIRLAWCGAELLHGAGHTLLRAGVDGDPAALSFANLLEHRPVGRVLAALLPLAPAAVPEGCHLPIPWLGVGDPTPGKVRLKASGGLLFNLAAAGLAGRALLAFPPEGPLLVRALLASGMVANGLLLLVSRSDWEAILSGRAVRFHCGNFGFISARDPSPARELLSPAAIARFRTMAGETEIRGAQAGGGLLLVQDRNGQPCFVGHKFVNSRRGDLTGHLEVGFQRRRRQARRAGCRPLPGGTLAAWHYRFGTSGPPALRETHWLEWSPAQRRRLWHGEEGRWVGSWRTIQHRITHNGDFEGFHLFGTDLDVGALGRWLELVLQHANPAVGDSPKIAGLMDLLISQGDWLASVRLACVKVLAETLATPAPADLHHWAAIFEATFQAQIRDQPRNQAGLDGEGCRRLGEAILQQVSRDPRLLHHGSTRIRRWIEAGIDAFLHNDPGRATRQFLERARGSFGLVVASSTWPDRLVLSSLGQPISIGFDPSDSLAVYASEPAAVDAVLAPAVGTHRIDLDPNAGEIAVLSATDLRVHSLSLGRELTCQELQGRRLGYGGSAESRAGRPPSHQELDPVAADLAEIPALLASIKDDWIDPGSANRRSAELLAQFLIMKAAYLAEKQQALLRLGLDPGLARSRHVDLLITGVENSLWLGERFAADLAAVMPLLRVKALSANVVLEQLQHDMESLGFARQSIVLVLTHSGQTFATRQVAEACDLLVRQEVIREFFLLTGEPTSFLGSPLLAAQAPGEPGCRRLFTTGAGRRRAEPATATVAAMHQTLTELLFALCHQVQQAFPGRQPLGLRLGSDGLTLLENMEDHLFLQDVAAIVGTDPKGQPLATATSRRLVRSGRRWALHVLETPIAWAIHALYILISVGWGLPLFQTFTPSLLGPASLPADIALYIFGPWCWTVVLRLAQGRQPLARTGRRTLVIGEVPGVQQLLGNYVSKLFALSFGVTALDVHTADPGDHLLHLYAHRLVRGTLLFLGLPDGRCSRRQRDRERAVILAARQADGIRHLRTGPEIVALGSDPAISAEPFTTAVVLPSPVHAGCAEAQQLPPHPFRNDDLIEAIRESRFGSFRRLLGGYVFFWAMARRVASLPLLRFDWWKSQSRTKVMTTAAPVSAARLDRSEPEEIAELALDARARREQS